MNFEPLSFKAKRQTSVTVGYRLTTGRLRHQEIYRLFGRTTPLGSDIWAIKSGRVMTFWLCDILTSPVSHSSLMNVLESWPAEACVIFPSFYREEAARLSRGIRSTLCRDRQTFSANKMECLCISHLLVNIQMPLAHWHGVCACERVDACLWHR